MQELTQPQAIERVAQWFDQQLLLRPRNVDLYQPGTRLDYDVRGIYPDRPGRVSLEIERFVGGGYAGQVYRVKLLEIDAPEGPIGELEVGGFYAMKILKPPAPMAQRFRDLIYKLGFQGPFTIQVNPVAARAGALWQKFIRRAAAETFGSERHVADIHATFTDPVIGACGEFSEWIDGRTWRYETDDDLSARRHWKPGQDDSQVGSPEYRAKKVFMDRLVEMLHEMGAPELARQYTWWTCKSQPNCLKRRQAETDPAGGLTAVDFRAGLALLPVLPMSPADVALIFKGLLRGSLVQFDRGNLEGLRRYVEARSELFQDMAGALDELRSCEVVYRNSMPDITHNHVRLLYSSSLWSQILDSTAQSYRVRGIADEETTEGLRASQLRTLCFWKLGLVAKLSLLAGVLVLLYGAVKWVWDGPAAKLLGNPRQWAWPLSGEWTLGAFAGIILGLLLLRIRAMWGRADIRRHTIKALTCPGYLLRAMRGRMAERIIDWVRCGRVSPAKAVALTRSPVRAFGHFLLSFIPLVFLHRMLTDRRYARDLLWYIFVRPVRLLFSPELREQWLREMVSDGQRRHMLTEEDAHEILSRIKEPYIQKYLKSLAVHVCTLPVTQLVGVIIGAWIAVSQGMNWAQFLATTGAIIAIFAVTPISPGSITRGLYVVYLVIRERNFRDYNIAVFLGFFKYVGYLAFPIQMAYRYPVLARFMAAHWATGAVHVVPVFGEHGALLEHGVFDLFYNYPLTLRRRLGEKAQIREKLAARHIHALGLGLLAAAGWIACASAYSRITGSGLVRWADDGSLLLTHSLQVLWPAVILLPALAGGLTSMLAGGLGSARRILLSVGCGALAGVLGAAAVLTLQGGEALSGRLASGAGIWHVSMYLLWRVFLFALLAALGGAFAETRPMTRPRLTASPTPAAESTGQ